MRRIDREHKRERKSKRTTPISMRSEKVCVCVCSVMGKNLVPFRSLDWITFPSHGKITYIRKNNEANFMIHNMSWQLSSLCYWFSICLPMRVSFFIFYASLSLSFSTYATVEPHLFDCVMLYNVDKSACNMRGAYQ